MSTGASTMSLDYISEIIHSISGIDPNIVGFNTKMVYDFTCRKCTNKFQLMIPPYVEIFSVKEVLCNKCNTLSATLLGE